MVSQVCVVVIVYPQRLISVAARMGEIDGARKIKAISGRFTSLRNELDSIIGLNTSKEVQYLGASHT